MRVIVPILFLFFMACSTHPEPGWISNQPNAENYWFGVGSVEKPFYGSDIREEARSKALSEIASQISVDISGSFEQVVTEHNLSLDEFAKSVVNTRVENNLPNIEIVDSYESKNRYYLLARLSQITYYETIEKKRRNAVKTAMGLLDKAESQLTAQSFTFLNEAMQELAPYMDVPLEEIYPRGSGKRINLYSYIKLLTNSFVNRLILTAEIPEVEIKLGFTRDAELVVRLMDKQTNNPVIHIPVSGYLQGEKAGASAVLSDSEGRCTFPLPTLKKKVAIQHLNFTVDTDELIGASHLFGDLPKIQTQVIIKVIPPDIQVQITENNLGKETDNPYVAPVIMEFFAAHYSANIIISNGADLIINGIVNTRSVSENPNDYGIYQVFADATLSISNGETGEKIIEKSFNKIQGSDFSSNREAANQALKKLSKRITEEFLPELSEILQGI